MSTRRIGARLGLVLVGLLGASSLLEAGLRATGHARSQLSIFEERDGRVGLRPCASDRVRRPDGVVSEIFVNAKGHRAAAACGEAETAPRDWVAGDSQAFGLGVSASEAFAGRLGFGNLGVPDYSVVDTLAAVQALGAPTGSTVWLVVNESNDWVDGLATSAERNVVRGGFLQRRARAGTLGAALWGTPLASSHLFYVVWSRLAPPSSDADLRWLESPESLAELTTGLGERVRRLAESSRATLRVLWLPADLRASEARAAESSLAPAALVQELAPWKQAPLRSAFAAALAPVPLIDLTPDLADPASFLARDYHLSEAGHAAVAARILREREP